MIVWSAESECANIVCSTQHDRSCTPTRPAPNHIYCRVEGKDSCPACSLVSVPGRQSDLLSSRSGEKLCHSGTEQDAQQTSLQFIVHAMRSAIYLRERPLRQGGPEEQRRSRQCLID